MSVMAKYRANYALVSFQEHLGPDEDGLDVPWASFSGDKTEPHTFEVPTGDPADAYIEMQVYDVGTYDHDVLINGEPLSGFDVPAREGWQYWMDTVTAARLREGENTIRFRRDGDTDDSFVVGSVTVHWKELVD
jgi:hypothetical protein